VTFSELIRQNDGPIDKARPEASRFRDVDLRSLLPNRKSARGCNQSVRAWFQGGKAMTTHPRNTGETSAQPAASDTAPADGSAEALALKLVSLLDQFEALVPGFLPHDATDIYRVAAAARFGSDLIPPAITAVTSFAPAADRNVFDVDRGKAALLFRDALRPVAHRLLALHDGLEFTIDSRVAEAGTEALQAYAWAKAFAKSPNGAGMRPYVGEMSRVVKRAQNRRKPGTPAPPTPPVQGFLAPSLASAAAAAAGDDDLPDDFRKALDAVSDEE